MIANVGRDEVRRLVAEGALMVDVLPADEFEIDHLPGAVNLPLEELDRARAERLDRTHVVILYCHDTQ